MKIIDADPLADLRAQPRSLVVPKLEVCNWHRGRPRKRSSKAFGLAAGVGGPKVKLAWPTNWQPMKTSESAHYWIMKNFSHAKQIPMTLTPSSARFFYPNIFDARSDLSRSRPHINNQQWVVPHHRLCSGTKKRKRGKTFRTTSPQ